MSEVTSLLPGGLDLSNIFIKSLSKKTMMMMSAGYLGLSSVILSTQPITLTMMNHDWDDGPDELLDEVYEHIHQDG